MFSLLGMGNAIISCNSKIKNWGKGECIIKYHLDKGSLNHKCYFLVPNAVYFHRTISIVVSPPVKESNKILILFCCYYFRAPAWAFGTSQEYRRKKRALSLDDCTDCTENGCWHNKPKQEKQAGTWVTGTIAWGPKQAGLVLKFHHKHSKCFFHSHSSPKYLLWNFSLYRLAYQIFNDLAMQKSVCQDPSPTCTYSCRKYYSVGRAGGRHTLLLLLLGERRGVFLPLACSKIRGNCVELGIGGASGHNLS